MDDLIKLSEKILEEVKIDKGELRDFIKYVEKNGLSFDGLYLTSVVGPVSPQESQKKKKIPPKGEYFKIKCGRCQSSDEGLIFSRDLGENYYHFEKDSFCPAECEEGTGKNLCQIVANYFLNKAGFGYAGPTVPRKLFELSKNQLDVLIYLSKNPGAVAIEIAKKFKKKRPQIAFYLSSLEKMGLIEKKRQGRYIVYEVKPEIKSLLLSVVSD